MVTAQMDLFGNTVVTGDLVDRLTYILEQYPAARDNYRVALARYWLEFDGLDRVLGDKTDAFVDWFTNHATSSKTLQNRTGEIQNQRRDLEASPEIARWRETQSKAGPVRY